MGKIPDDFSFTKFYRKFFKNNYVATTINVGNWLLKTKMNSRFWINLDSIKLTSQQ